MPQENLEELLKGLAQIANTHVAHLSVDLTLCNSPALSDRLRTMIALAEELRDRARAEVARLQIERITGRPMSDPAAANR